jgi:phage-related protein
LTVADHLLLGLHEPARRAIGQDLMRAQFRWAVGMLLVRPMGNGLWGGRTKLPDNRIARVFLSFVQGRLIALHGFIKKTQQTPDAELRLPRKRKQENP